jgi:hypothetical protein
MDMNTIFLVLLVVILVLVAVGLFVGRRLP